jgi:hypothetical protein
MGVENKGLIRARWLALSVISLTVVIRVVVSRQCSEMIGMVGHAHAASYWEALILPKLKCPVLAGSTTLA